MLGYLWDALKVGWNAVKGYKTYIVAVSAVVYGWYAGDKDAVLLGLGLAGLRHGLSNELIKLVPDKKKAR